MTHPSRVGPWMAFFGGLLVALSMPPTATAATIDVDLGTVKGAPGQVVAAPVLVKAKQGIGSMEFELVFNPRVLEFKAIEQGPMLLGALLSSNASESGRVIVALVSGEPVKGDGIILEAQFAVRSDAPLGPTELKLEKLRAWEHGLELLEMLTHQESGQVIVESPGWPLWVYITIGAVVLVSMVVLAALARRSFARPT